MHLIVLSLQLLGFHGCRRELVQPVSRLHASRRWVETKGSVDIHGHFYAVYCLPGNAKDRILPPNTLDIFYIPSTFRHQIQDAHAYRYIHFCSYISICTHLYIYIGIYSYKHTHIRTYASVFVVAQHQNHILYSSLII